MAITSIDQLIAGMRPPENFIKIGTAHKAIGQYHSHFYAVGLPSAAPVPDAGVNGEALTTYSGQIPFDNPASGNTYLARLQASSSATGCLLLLDRLWHNSGLSPTSTNIQELTSVAWPPRDRDGAAYGKNVLVGLEVSTTMGAGTPVCTLGYTNDAGENGKTATFSGLTTSSKGTFYIWPLAEGDTGIRSIQSYQQSATWTSGAIHLVAFRILARMELTLPNTGNSIDAISGGFVRLYDNTVPFLVWLPTATALVTVAGQVIYAQG